MNARMFRDYEILFRASNTQPALVMRCEAVSAERLAELRGPTDSHLAAARRVTA